MRQRHLFLADVSLGATRTCMRFSVIRVFFRRMLVVTNSIFYQVMIKVSAESSVFSRIARHYLQPKLAHFIGGLQPVFHSLRWLIRISDVVGGIIVRKVHLQ